MLLVVGSGCLPWWHPVANLPVAVAGCIRTLFN